MIAILKRELQAYFSSMLAWILMAVFLFIHGLIYVNMTARVSEYSMTMAQNPFSEGFSVTEFLVTGAVSTMGFLMLLMLPMLTMRLFAEEKSTGTLDLLFTYPLTEAQIIGGKFLSALSVVALMLAFSVSSFLMLARSAPGPGVVEWPLVGSGYAGLLLFSGAMVAFGMWCSSLTSSQLVAAVVTYGGSLVVWLISVLDRGTFLKDIFGDLSFEQHLQSLARGALESHDLVYFIGWTILFLFLTARVLESRKWRG